MSRRVVITGFGGISCLGDNWDAMANSLKAQKNFVVTMDEWDKFDGLNTRLAARLPTLKSQLTTREKKYAPWDVYP